MNSNKKLCCCDDCSSKSNGEGKYMYIKTWNRHKKKMDLFNELEDNLDSDNDSLMSTDDEKMKSIMMVFKEITFYHSQVFYA